ncbi:protein kinase domain-containing protein [Barrientosiimonas endolithica]|uniref:Protein kinase domain-containing protein n=1 Tax=Barrientosiimonas endolithica TaxID=1535208 RepID=A0ABN6YJN3_9MICO|nr:protein kinase [Barrientosiimonas endolithica]BDZ57682.1 hypothetical protein GCM10025872_13390 [Barrientosiimonas endolithica]
MRQHEDDGDDLDRVGEDVRPEPPDLPGYRVGAHLGSGASGMVWAVTRAADDARLAAKVLLAPVEEACSETAFLQRLEHEHVLRLHDTVLDTSGPVPRLAMITDLAEGGSLGTAVAGRGHLTVGEVVTVLTPLARTLHDLHGQGLVHGDLSPANVLLDAHGKPLLADFGIARLAAGDDAQLWGTTGFVAPEVLAGSGPSPPPTCSRSAPSRGPASSGRRRGPPRCARTCPTSPRRRRRRCATSCSAASRTRPRRGRAPGSWRWRCGTPHLPSRRRCPGRRGRARPRRHWIRGAA